MEKTRVVEIRVNQYWCKSCGICIEFCPKEVFDEGERNRAYPARPEQCNGCELCERICPDLAITLVRSDGDRSDG